MKISELGLSENDFTFELIEIGKSKILIAKIDDITFKISSIMSVEFKEDLKWLGLDIDAEFEKILKEEAINSVINNNQFIRKLKLKKIKEKYEK